MVTYDGLIIVIWKHFNVLTGAVELLVPIVSKSFLARAKLAVAPILPGRVITQAYVWKGKCLFCLSYYLLLCSERNKTQIKGAISQPYSSEPTVFKFWQRFKHVESRCQRNHYIQLRNIFPCRTIHPYFIFVHRCLFLISISGVHLSAVSRDPMPALLS